MSALPALLLSLAAFFAEPLFRPEGAVLHAQGGGQLVAVTEENAAGIASSVWVLNRARTVEAFLIDTKEISDDYRSLVSYAAPDTPIEVACPFSGSIELRGMVEDDSVGPVAGETTFAEYRDCARRDFLNIELKRNGVVSLTIIDANSASDRVTFDLTNDYTAVVTTPPPSSTVRATFTGTTRYTAEITAAAGTLTASSDRFSVVGSTLDGAENIDVRAFMSSLVLTRRNGVFNYAKSFLGRYEGTPFGGAVIVNTDTPLTGVEEDFPASGGFTAEGAAASKVSLGVVEGQVFLFVDADGDGNDDDQTPAVFSWPEFEALAGN